MIYEDITTLIPNITMQKVYTDSKVFIVYRITPVEGYILHNNMRDWTDDDTNELYLGYSEATSSVPTNYDFTQTTVIDGYTAYGDREIFARPASEVPENQIFGGGNTEPKPEVM